MVSLEGMMMSFTHGVCSSTLGFRYFLHPTYTMPSPEFALRLPCTPRGVIVKVYPLGRVGDEITFNFNFGDY